MAAVQRDALAEEALRGWLGAPWIDFEHQCAMVRALGYVVSLDPELIQEFGPKGILAPEEVGVVLLREGALSAMSFGELDFPSPTGPVRFFIREFWFFRMADETPWLDFLCEELGSDPHAKHEPTSPPILSWVWGKESEPDSWLRLTHHPDGGMKITQIRKIQSEQG